MKKLLEAFRFLPSPVFVRARPIILLLCCLISTVLVSPQSSAFAAGIEVLTPRQGDTIITRNPETHLILRRAEVGTPSVVAIKIADTVHGIRGSRIVTESSSDLDKFSGASPRSR